MNNSFEDNRRLSPSEVDGIVWGLVQTLEEQRFVPKAVSRLKGRLGDIAAGDRAREAAVNYSFWNGRTGGGVEELKQQALVDKAKALAARDNPLDPRDDADGAFKAELRSPRKRFDDEEWPASGEAMRALGILSRNPRKQKRIEFTEFDLMLKAVASISGRPTDMMILSNLP